jgi:enolase
MSEFTIAYVKGLQVIDSRGDPTIEAIVITEGGGIGRAIAPSGASKGKYEAIDLRDGGKDFGGRGVKKAVDGIAKFIAPAIIGMDSSKYREVDRKLIEIDGTPNKSKLGGNACIAVSLANIKAASDTAMQPLFEFIGGMRSRTLPVPMMNIINGGAHAGNELSIQEFMIMPIGASSFSEAMKMAIEVYKTLKSLLKERYGPLSINVGDEGGFAPPMKSSREALNAIVSAINRSGYDSENDIVVALDAAATQFYDEAKKAYIVDGNPLSRNELIDYYASLVDEFPIKSIEDPFHEESPEDFKMLKQRLHGKALIIGDDLTVTQLKKVKDYLSSGVIDGAIIKVNQVGTFSEAEDTIKYLLNNNGKAIISHRSGESEDTTIAHIAVGFETGLIKAGAPARGERTAKYNELLRIEDLLGGEAVYPGKDVLLR